MELEFSSVKLNNGKILCGKKIGELTEFVINKFYEEQFRIGGAIGKNDRC